MALKKNQIQRTIFRAGLLFIIFISTFFNYISVFALEDNYAVLPTFTNFSQVVRNGKADVLSGVYVPNVLALRVVQQPAGNSGYVSNNDDQVTQFGMASQFGTVGLLAHNYLSGEVFSHLAVGQEVRLVYGDGKVEYFVVKEILKYQALQPNSPWSSFRNLEDNAVLTAEEMFKRVYAGERHVTFQTCIYGEGISSWGRLFVVAVPKTDFSADELRWRGVY